MITGIGSPSLLRKILVPAQTAGGGFYFPSNGVLREVLANNNTANAVTGGLKFGTTGGGTDIIAALAVGANALAFTTDSALLKRWFSASARQAIFFDAVVSWNSANVDLTFIYYQL